MRNNVNWYTRMWLRIGCCEEANEPSGSIKRQ
jgi:hypothetical protein